MANRNGRDTQHTEVKLEQALSSPIIQTRLRIPPARAKLVQRPRLAASIEQALEGRFLLISAPAGYGKTTLLSAWANQSSWPVAWYSLDSADNDQTRFMSYLIHALQRIQGQVGKITLELLTAQQTQTAEMLLTPLVNELLEVPPMVLILDDYQVIEAQRIHEALLFLLEHLPASVHLIIATRTDLPLPLARLRAQHQLRELRTSELRFNREESAAFLLESMELALQAEAIDLLDERNQGWITGLQLAALAMQGRAQQSNASPAVLHQFVFDYLAEEVMQQLPLSLQEFLLKTSVLTHLDASLCEAVTDQVPGQPRLDFLETHNLFLIPLDQERTWYRYHPLFAEFLQKRLSQSAPESITQLRMRASIWCEQHNYLDEAIQYALAAEQYPRAAELIVRSARTLLAKRDLFTLIQWIEKLPVDIVQAQPQVGITYCWALLFTFQPERIGPLLQQIQKVLAETAASEDTMTQQLQGEIAAIQAIQASIRGDRQQTIVLSQQALTWLADEDLWTRATLVFFQGVAYYVTGDMPGAQQAYREAWAFAQRAGNHSLALLVCCYLARLSLTIGKLQEARQTLETAREQVEHHHLFTLAGGLLLVELGNIYYEQNEMDSAHIALTRSIEIGKALASTDILRAGYLALARWQQARGQVEEVHRLWKQLDQLKLPASVLWVDAEIQAYRLQWKNWYSGAAQERGLSEQAIEEAPISVLNEIEHLARARVLIGEAHYDSALDLLAKLWQRAEDEQRVGSIISIAVLQAKALFASDNRAEALKAIQRALSLAAPQRYTRIFIDEGEQLRAILQQAVTHGIQSSYVLELLHAFPESPSRNSYSQALLDPLSERELEVLQCVAKGQSNQSIADGLHVSLNTVKTHMNHIFAKLHVNSRTQAVARASELQLFPMP